MNFLGKGVKPVVFENNVKLPFYGTNIEDSYIDVDRIHAKVTADGAVAAYGECTLLLLFSYMNTRREKFFIAQSKNIIFSEKVDCSLPSNQNYDLLAAQAAFEPSVACKRSPGSGYVWNIEVKGEISVMVSGSPLSEIKSFHGETTVMPLNSLNLSPEEVLKMDAGSLSGLLKNKKDETPAETAAISEKEKSES